MEARLVLLGSSTALALALVGGLGTPVAARGGVVDRAAELVADLRPFVALLIVGGAVLALLAAVVRYVGDLRRTGGRKGADTSSPDGRPAGGNRLARIVVTTPVALTLVVVVAIVLLYAGIDLALMIARYAVGSA